MKKELLKVFLGIGCSIIAVSAMAQSAVTEGMIRQHISAPAPRTSNTSSHKMSTVTCGPDTILYPYLKELAFAAPDDSFFVDAMVGNVRTASQAYLLNSPVNVVGVQFWGGAYSTNPNFVQALPVKVYLYAVNSTAGPTQYQPTTILDSAIVTIGTNYDFYEVNFATPHPVSTDFAVAVRSSINDTLAVITNNAGNVWSPDYSEGLAWRRFGSGVWNQSAAFFGQDLEYMIFPIVTYNVTSSFTAPDDSTCTGNAMNFTNTSSSLYGNRMFNLYAFDEYWGFATADSTFEWNYGDNSTWTSSMNGSHTYSTAGTYNVKLAGEMLGYYTTCDDTMTMAITVMPQVTAGFTYDASQEPMISFTESATGESTYFWDFGDGNTSTAANPGNTYAAAGTYNVSLTVTGYCGTNTTTQSVTITSVGIQQVSGNINVNSFYSKEDNALHISLPSAAVVEVYDILGQQVFAKKLEAASHVISMGNAEGTYVVRVTTANGTAASKFAVIK